MTSEYKYKSASRVPAQVSKPLQFEANFFEKFTNFISFVALRRYCIFLGCNGYHYKPPKHTKPTHIGELVHIRRTVNFLCMSSFCDQNYIVHTYTVYACVSAVFCYCIMYINAL